MNAEERFQAAVASRLGNHIKRAEQAMIAEKTRALRPHGLTVPQYAAMYVLSLDPGVSGARLARACHVTPQSMGPLLAGLEARGLVERTPSEHHSQVLVTRLTRSGQALLRAADAAALAVEARMAEALGEGEPERLRELLGRVVEALNP